MPLTAGVGVPILVGAISGGSAAGATIYGSHKSAKAAKDAATIQGRANDAALAFEREQEASRRKEYEEERARDWMNEDADRAMKAADRDRRLRLARPYEDLGQASTEGLLGMLQGRIPFDPRVAPRPAVPTNVPTRGPALGMPSLTAATAPQGTAMDEATMAALLRRAPVGAAS